MTTARGCEFGLCTREAELELLFPSLHQVRVCALHLTPVISWGIAAPAEPLILYLANRPESAGA